MEIGAIIKKLREEHGMLQEELAKYLGVTYQAVSTWETGKRLPRMGSIEKMSLLFGVTKSYIIGEEDDSIYFEFKITDEEQRLIIAYRKATPETRRNIQKILSD